jgi:hypothetical protein
VADVKYTFEFLIEGLFVIEVVAEPIQRMPGRRLEIAFTGHGEVL